MNIEVSESEESTVQITLRGKPKALIAALMNGLPVESLAQLHAVFSAELARQATTVLLASPVDAPPPPSGSGTNTAAPSIVFTGAPTGGGRK